jgi:hypothetical protein
LLLLNADSREVTISTFVSFAAVGSLPALSNVA